MHQEFITMLNRSLNPAGVGMGNVDEHARALLECKTLLGRPFDLSDLGDCPPHVQADFACNAAFAISQKLKAQSILITPVQAAQNICRRMTEVDLNSWFRVEPGPYGQLNVSVNESFKSEFFSALVDQGAGALFRTASLLLPEEAGEGIVDVDVPLLFKQERFLTKIAGQTESEIETVLNCDADPVDRCMMVLAMMADREIDSQFYLKKLNGRQNVPWYLERFKKDRRCFLRSLKKQGLVAPSPWSFDIAEVPALRPHIHKLVDAVLSFRKTYLWAARSAKPQLLMASLLGLAQKFYTIYNRPDVRDLAFRQTHSVTFSCLAGLLTLVDQINSEGRGRLEAPFKKVPGLS